MGILGIDPGYERMGYAFIETGLENSYNPACQENAFSLIEAGCITTSAKKNFPSRLVELEQGLEILLKKFVASHVAVERLFYVKTWKGSLKTAEARGVILKTLAKAGLEISEYAPTQVKKGVTGNGAATKSHVMLMTAKLLDLKKPLAEDNAADAVALALVHAFHLSQNRAILQNNES